MTEIHLRVLVPKNRTLPGWLRVEKNHTVLRDIQVLARGSRGPGDTQFKRNGNTPTGTYDGSLFQTTQGLDPKAYGKWGRIRLRPVSGNALIAEQTYGRNGLLIHGGDLATKGPWKGGLKPTNGCLRVSNADMEYLRDLFYESSLDGGQCSVPHVVVSVQE